MHVVKNRLQLQIRFVKTHIGHGHDNELRYLVIFPTIKGEIAFKLEGRKISKIFYFFRYKKFLFC